MSKPGKNKFVFGHQASVSSGDACWFNGDIVLRWCGKWVMMSVS